MTITTLHLIFFLVFSCKKLTFWAKKVGILGIHVGNLKTFLAFWGVISNKNQQKLPFWEEKSPVSDKKVGILREKVAKFTKKVGMFKMPNFKKLAFSITQISLNMPTFFSQNAHFLAKNNK